MSLFPISIFNAGQWRQQYEYKSFSPSLINQQWLPDDPALQALVEEASRGLGELNAYSQMIPDVDFFIQMHVFKEATASSRIEGTQTNVEEAFFKDEDIGPDKKDDWQEVQNYIQAMNTSIDMLATLPLSTRLLREAHRILLQGVRGQYKQPGEFRQSQNWIGGASLKDAVFIPPHPDELPELLSDFEKFLHNDQIQLPALIRIGIAHYQFETIHPFLDGNGRIGRLLIGLDLVSKGLLSKPALYLSDFFERHKSLYYDNLTRVRSHHDLNQWLKFFMVAMIESSRNAVGTFKNILLLKEEIDSILLSLGGRAKIAKILIQKLYATPVCHGDDVERWLGVTPPTANALLKALQEAGLIKEITGFKRNRLFKFEPYLKIFTA